MIKTLPTTLIFDMDGLLLDTERLSYEAWVKTCCDSGLNIDPIYKSLIGKGVATVDKILSNYFGSGFRIEEMRFKKDKVFEQILISDGIPLKTGAASILERARSLGVKTALATSSRRDEALRRLSIASLKHVFDAYVFGDEVQQTKPAPDIFLLASQRLGIEPSRCIVIEDSHSGVEAALGAGTQVIMVPDLLQPEDWMHSRGVMVSHSLEDVSEYLFAR